jgi:hypothetical protein
MDARMVMESVDLDENEFNEFYEAILGLIRQHGTIGVQTMLAYVEQELNEGREDIE